MEHNAQENKPKKRSLTELTLGWIAEKLRKSEEIKAQIQNGTYSVDPQKVAKKIIDPEN
jgi:anti-sigma28 factor (negative regulator of flagellin synthesis)